MNQEILLEQIIREFEKWYNKDPHKKNISHYDTIMNKNVIENYTDTEFIDFFYNFVIISVGHSFGNPAPKQE